MKLISNPKYLENAWHEQYHRVAKKFADLLPSKKGTLVEIGCGKGQLTIPLARVAPRCIITAVDTFGGPYSKNYKLLRLALRRKELSRRIRIIVSDHLTWLSKQPSHSHDGVISNEFLPEIDSEEMDNFLSECYRIVKLGGVTIHGFLSPQAKNSRQKLLIEADSNNRWTKFPPREWFSPKPELIASRLRKIGLKRLRTSTIKSNLGVKANAAQELLRSWRVKDTFWEFYKDRLILEGLEIPDWVITAGTKHDRKH